MAVEVVVVGPGEIDDIAGRPGGEVGYLGCSAGARVPIQLVVVLAGAARIGVRARLIIDILEKVAASPAGEAVVAGSRRLSSMSAASSPA
jgi:hypothetical protein